MLHLEGLDTKGGCRPDDHKSLMRHSLFYYAGNITFDISGASKKSAVNQFGEADFVIIKCQTSVCDCSDSFAF